MTFFSGRLKLNIVLILTLAFIGLIFCLHTIVNNRVHDVTNIGIDIAENHGDF